MAAVASSALVISTNANPRDCPVSRSRAIRDVMTMPYGSNSSAN